MRGGGVTPASYFTAGEENNLATSLPARANLGSCPLGNHNSWLRFGSVFVVFLMGRVSERRPDRCHFLSPTPRLSGAPSTPVVCLLNAGSSNRLDVSLFSVCVCFFASPLLGLPLKCVSCPCSLRGREFGRWKVNSLALERQENNGFALPLDPEFLQTIRQLGRRPSLSAITDNIIRKYGTHFLLSATLGGKKSRRTGTLVDAAPHGGDELNSRMGQLLTWSAVTLPKSDPNTH